MKPDRTSPEAYTLLSRFDEVCKELGDGEHTEKLARPLGYWALKRDRRLPYALLGRTLGQLINTAFTDISATPGIGPKKIASLVMLLERAAAEEASQDVGPESGSPPSEHRAPFDAAAVSESSWELWKEAVRRFELEDEALGRLAPTLRALPTVIWKTPLGRYLDLSLHEIRTLKTHGEKRVSAVLQVFYTVHRGLRGGERYGRLVLRPIPSFVIPIEQWLLSELPRSMTPGIDDLRQNLTLPLLNQIEIDVGETVQRLAAGRLGIESAPENVGEQARRVGVTRARIYQLLETCSHVMDVRWPQGRWWLAALSKKFEHLDADDDRLLLFTATRSLLYPDIVGAGSLGERHVAELTAAAQRAVE